MASLGGVEGNVIEKWAATQTWPLGGRAAPRQLLQAGRCLFVSISSALELRDELPR